MPATYTATNAQGFVNKGFATRKQTLKKNDSKKDKTTKKAKQNIFIYVEIKKSKKGSHLVLTI